MTNEQLITLNIMHSMIQSKNLENSGAAQERQEVRALAQTLRNQALLLAVGLWGDNASTKLNEISSKIILEGEEYVWSSSSWKL